MGKNKKILYTCTASLLLLILIVYVLVVAKSFLAPLTVAIILTLLLAPIVRKLEQWNVPKNLAALLTTLASLLVSFGFFLLVIVQTNNVVEQWDTIQETMQPKIVNATDFLIENTPVTQKKIDGLKNKLSSFRILGSTKQANSAVTYLSSIVNFLGIYLLVFIYIFFMLRFRLKFKKFILKFFDDEQQSEVKSTLQQITNVAQGYLIGKLKLIGILAVVYSIGLGISGVNNFILVALISALLTIIPYLGNVIGYCLALIFGYLVQGDMSVLIGVSVTFVVAQFIESYILQPYIIGNDVDVNPFFVILAVIASNLIWGVAGMVVAIPILGIINVVFLHVPGLKPFGFLIKKTE
ncbi:putative PurR-regulated permease PerM [Marinirhabdus gelatinilytica]|uniref:Putative PurR-regulated permease PerM n=2 Tax=Marinirhabdus gelatinilytica TaxID=1703343 RepID=A0A370QFH6_9FLAO|nr:putative PurR-regulated permease PerM [Marinirhabdus gelatinilytica]